MNGNRLAVASAEKSFRSARMRLHEQILPMHVLMARPSAANSHRPFSESTLNGVTVWVPFFEIVWRSFIIGLSLLIILFNSCVGTCLLYTSPSPRDRQK